MKPAFDCLGAWFPAPSTKDEMEVEAALTALRLPIYRPDFSVCRASSEALHTQFIQLSIVAKMRLPRSTLELSTRLLADSGSTSSPPHQGANVFVEVVFFFFSVSRMARHMAKTFHLMTTQTVPLFNVDAQLGACQSSHVLWSMANVCGFQWIGDNGMPLVVREPHPHDPKLEANLSMPRLQRVSFGGHSHVATLVTTPGACRVFACFAASRRPVPSSREMCRFLMVTTRFRSHAMRMSGCLVQPRYNLSTRWRLARNTR